MLIYQKIDYTVNTFNYFGGIFMSDQNQPEVQKKKVSLQEAMKQQLENKKNKAAGGNSHANNSQATKRLTSQQTKKVSNSRRKMGV